MALEIKNIVINKVSCQNTVSQISEISAAIITPTVFTNIRHTTIAVNPTKHCPSQYSITKKIVINGAAKSAYDLWIEAGNSGTQQDYLNANKGKDAEQLLFISDACPLTQSSANSTVLWLQTNLNGDPNAFTLNLVRKK